MKVKTLTKTSALAEVLMELYDNYEGTQLEDVYANPSPPKQEAYEEIVDYYFDGENNFDFHICEHTSRDFTCCWESENGYKFMSMIRHYIVPY